MASSWNILYGSGGTHFGFYWPSTDSQGNLVDAVFEGRPVVGHFNEATGELTFSTPFDAKHPTDTLWFTGWVIGPALMGGYFDRLEVVVDPQKPAPAPNGALPHTKLFRAGWVAEPAIQ